MKAALPDYTVGEEVANAVTHGVGVGLSIAGLVILVVVACSVDDAWRVVSFSIYGSTLILLYLASTLYHAFPWPRVKQVFRLLDHTSIFLLIAGTYTPVALVTLRGPTGWRLFGIIWGLAIAGIIYKIIFLGRLRIVSVLLYIGMGWMAVIAWNPLLDHTPTGFMAWLLIGGASYTLGTIFYAMKRLRYHHAIWHLFVLGGSISHFFAMLLYIAPV